MKAPLITAVIPTYNRPHFLKRSVKSVLSQTYPDFEILIANNNSEVETDQLIQGLCEKDRRIRHLKHSITLPATQNFQAGLEQAKTPYVCFLPDDDFYTPNFFEDTLAAFKRHPDIIFAGGRGTLFIDHNYLVKGHNSDLHERSVGGYYPASTAFLSNLQLPSSLFNTEALKSLGGFDLRLSTCFDSDILNKSIAQYPVYVIADRVFYFHYEHAGSLTLAFDYFKQEKECQYLLENILKISFNQREKEVLIAWFKRWELNLLSKLYGQEYRQKNFKSASARAYQLYMLTQSPRWKSRQRRAFLYSKFPSFYNLYEGIHKIEQAIRHRIKPKVEREESPSEYHIHAEAARWKQFALSLEERY